MNRRRDQGPPRRPLGVTLLALLQLWHGVAYVLIFLFFAAASSTMTEPDEKKFSGIVFLLAIVYLLMGVYGLWLARGYVKGYEWARRRGVAIATFAIVLIPIEYLILRIPGLLEESPLITIIGNVIIIWYLSRSKVKSYFASRTAYRGG